MAVQFILGRAGSGKTHYCLEAIRAELRLSQRGPTLVFLVPEQATYQTERALVTTPGVGGYCRAHVLSFRRLAYEVLIEVGGSALAPLEATGKQMILRSILRRRGADLRLFEKSARQRGFVERLAATLSEMRSYGHGADHLRAELSLLDKRGEGETLLAAKIHDLAIVFEDYERFLAERYVDPDSYLDLLAERLSVPNSFHGARVWIDGFASFTGQEERVLGVLMRIAAETRIALCLDPVVVECERTEAGDDSERASQRLTPHSAFRTPHSAIRNPQSADREVSMFALLRETYERLKELARANGQLVLPPCVLPEPNLPTRFSKSPALAHLEQHLFSFDSDKSQSSFHNPKSAIRNPQSVVLTSAADQRCEVRDVACEILRLCRDNGYRFRDMAVIVRDLTPYRALIETIFRDYEIPHFLDIRRDVAHHPLVELVRSALAVARNWRTRDVIRYAKSDLALLDRAAVDQLENYALEHGIEGPAWHRPEPWRFQRRRGLDEDSEPREGKTSLDRINAWRQSLVEPIRRFERESARESATVLDISRALYEMLEEIGVAERLEQWAAEAERAGRLTEADEHRQVWEALMDLLDQAVAALGGESVGLDEYGEIIEAGLEGIRLRLVPPALDQVLVGSIERSRHPEIRAAFVLGLNERLFPRPQLPDIVFADRERERLAGDGLSLGPVSEKRLLHEQFLAYIAFTRPSERLYVSYAEADPLGKALHPSPYVDELRRCFAGNEDTPAIRRVERDQPLDRIAHPRDALAALAAGLRPASSSGLRPLAFGQHPTWIALYGSMRRDGQLYPALARRVGGLAYENRARLSRPLARRLYDLRTESSVSRLETFAACPFKHFARYGLGLEERLQFRLELFDLGLLYHAVLKDVFEQLSGGKPLNWTAVEPSRATAAVENAIERLAPRLRNEILLSSGRNRYLLETARAALTTFIRVVLAASQRDGFRQAAAEVAFGRGEKNRYGPLEIVLDEQDRLLLRGRIDRIDIATANPDVIRIVDYKSHGRRFYLGELIHGLALQLPTYLLAVEHGAAERSGKQPLLAGALFVPILRRSQSLPPGRMAEAAQAAAAALDLKPWQARGFFEFRWAALFDAEVASGGGRSPIVALAVAKDGRPYASEAHDALPDGALDGLLRWTERKLAELGREIVSGKTDVAPYQLGNDRACRMCEFQPLCRFDAHHQRYRALLSYSRDEALERIGQQIAEDS